MERRWLELDSKSAHAVLSVIGRLDVTSVTVLVFVRSLLFDVRSSIKSAIKSYSAN